MKVFVSYSHVQGDWVRTRLVPCLKAGGSEVLIDLERFEGGKNLIGQMDTAQNEADKHILVLSPDYLDSDYCIHEMNQAIQFDVDFKHGLVIPVIRIKSKLPSSLKKPTKPLFVDLSNDKQSDHWDPLLRACKADLGCKVPDWLAALDAITKALRKEGSINLVTRRSPTTKRGPNWRALIKHLQKDIFNNIGIGLVDLGRPATYSRPGLVKALLNTCSPSTATPKKPRYDEWDDISERPSACYVAMTHFHFVEHRRHYGPDLFYALNYMMMETKKLVLLIQSEDKTFVELLPDNVSLPDLKMDTIELNAHP